MMGAFGGGGRRERQPGGSGERLGTRDGPLTAALLGEASG